MLLFFSYSVYVLQGISLFIFWSTFIRIKKILLIVLSNFSQFFQYCNFDYIHT